MDEETLSPIITFSGRDLLYALEKILFVVGIVVRSDFFIFILYLGRIGVNIN